MAPRKSVTIKDVAAAANVSRATAARALNGYGYVGVAWPLNAAYESQRNQWGCLRPFNSLGCIVCRSGLYSLPFLAEERQDALENQY